MTIYLPDIEPGSAIRHLSKLAQHVACTVERSLKYFTSGKGIVTGYPLRSAIRASADIGQAEALAEFNLESDRQTVLITGGSRGARSINRALMASLPQLLDQLQVIHVSGELDWPEVEANANNLPPEMKVYYRPYPYLHEQIGFAYRSADLIVTRAGASILGECPAFGLPAILVPYPYAWRYQKVNAEYLVNQGAAIQIKDEDLPDLLLPSILDLVKDGKRLEKMSLAAKRLDTPNAASNLAQLLLDLGGRKMA
jgi:UDP-N-acetylglucosamine--N-acetylmuramyl-(pentapeptide) pyrophosphoryl-undecaprenol N-acetylglucosamine transferase